MTYPKRSFYLSFGCYFPVHSYPAPSAPTLPAHRAACSDAPPIAPSAPKHLTRAAPPPTPAPAPRAAGRPGYVQALLENGAAGPAKAGRTTRRRRGVAVTCGCTVWRPSSPRSRLLAPAMEMRNDVAPPPTSGVPICMSRVVLVRW